MRVPTTGLSVLLPLLVALAGCASDPGPDTGSPGGGAPSKADDPTDTGDGATLTFDEEFGESIAGTLSAGHAVRVRYDSDRLPDCRGDLAGGTPGWAITGHASIDGGDELLVSFTPSRDDATVLEGLVGTLPSGGDLSLYFTVTSRWGCIAYDSDYGANYHFAIASPPPADGVELRFTGDYDAVLSGPIHAGDRLHVLYDLARLPDCRGTMSGYPAWGVSGYWSVDGGAEHVFEVSRVEGSDRVAQEALITVPAGRELAFWFGVTNRWGCHAWDSNYGGNWTFAIE